MGFEDFLRQEKDKRKDKPTPANFDRLVREWQLEVKNLHDRIEKWLAAEIEQELLDILRGYPYMVREPGLPEWETDIMVIIFDELEIVIRPISRFKGEHQGELIVEAASTARHLAQVPQAAADGFNNWYIERTDELVPLNESNFKEFLQELISAAK